MATTYTKKYSYMGDKAVVFGKVTCVSGETSIAIATGLRWIDFYNVSPTSESAKPTGHATIADGTITVNFTEPTDTMYFYYAAYGVF